MKEERNTVKKFLKSLSKTQTKKHEKAITILKDRVVKKRHPSYYRGSRIGLGTVITEIAVLSNDYCLSLSVPLKELIVSLKKLSDTKHVKKIICMAVGLKMVELKEDGTINVPKD